MPYAVRLLRILPLSDIQEFLWNCLITMSLDPQKFGFLNQLQLKTTELRTFEKKHHYCPSDALFSAGPLSC